MKTATTMTMARFEKLADAYGGNIDAWPEADQPQARLFAAGPQQQAAERLLTEAAALDAALTEALGQAPAPSEDLMARVLADAAAVQKTFGPAASQPAPPLRPVVGRRGHAKGAGATRGRGAQGHLSPGRAAGQRTRRVALIFAASAAAGLAMGLFAAPSTQPAQGGRAEMTAFDAKGDPLTALMLAGLSDFDGGLEEYLDG